MNEVINVNLTLIRDDEEGRGVYAICVSYKGYVVTFEQSTYNAVCFTYDSAGNDINDIPENVYFEMVDIAHEAWLAETRFWWYVSLDAVVDLLITNEFIEANSEELPF